MERAEARKETMRWQTRRKQSSTDKSIYFLFMADEIRSTENFLVANWREEEAKRQVVTSVNTELERWPVGMAGNRKARDNLELERTAVSSIYSDETFFFLSLQT